MTTHDQQIAAVDEAQEVVTELMTGRWPAARAGKEKLRRAFHHFPGAAHLRQLLKSEAPCSHTKAEPMVRHNLWAGPSCRRVVDSFVVRKTPW